jgi:hypothetical protein
LMSRIAYMQYYDTSRPNGMLHLYNILLTNKQVQKTNILKQHDMYRLKNVIKLQWYAPYVQCTH